jgi:CheY-like chemotaxis protein
MDTSPQKVHILIIDDDPVLRRLFGSLLGNAGYEVLDAPDADQGQEMAERLQPDLILMDKNLPGIDGIKASGRLKKEPKTAHIPIVLLTNEDLSIETEKKMKEVSIADYIQKRLSNEEFIMRVKKILNATAHNVLQE